MAFDAHKNFAYSLVGTAPSPASSGTSLTVGAGDGTKFSAVPFNATVWPPNVQPSTTNAEIVRVTNIVGDVLTITRAQEGTAAIAIGVNYQIAETVTAKVFTDIETPVTTIVASTPQNPPNDVSKFLRGDSPATWSRIQNVVTTTSTGTLNDFAPGLVSGAINFCRCNNAADATLTGLSATGIADGTIAIFESIGAGNVYFKHQNAGSLVANRFTNMATSGDTPISKGVAIFRYDLTSTTWRLIQHEQGAWIQSAYNGANYQASTGTWTVDAGDIAQLRYRLSGRTLMIAMAISSTSVSATPTGLSISNAAYGGFTVAAPQCIAPVVISDGGTFQTGFMQSGTVPGNPSSLGIQKYSGNFTASTNTTQVYGQIGLEVN